MSSILFFLVIICMIQSIDGLTIQKRIQQQQHVLQSHDDEMIQQQQQQQQQDLILAQTETQTDIQYTSVVSTVYVTCCVLNGLCPSSASCELSMVSAITGTQTKTKFFQCQDPDVYPMFRVETPTQVNGVWKTSGWANTFPFPALGCVPPSTMIGSDSYSPIITVSSSSPTVTTIATKNFGTVSGASILKISCTSPLVLSDTHEISTVRLLRRAPRQDSTQTSSIGFGSDQEFNIRSDQGDQKLTQLPTKFKRSFD